MVICMESKNMADIANYDIRMEIVEKLKERNISELFPVQYMTYEAIHSGKDAVVLARTGTGKTLAFSIPLVDMVLRDETSGTTKFPSVLVLAPTRELVVQITADFNSICGVNVNVLAVYGGVPYGPQRLALRSGVNVVVGTPGRIIDLIDKNFLQLSCIKHVVLDEVDRMLDMGFSKDVEKILSQLYMKDENKLMAKKPQTLLFSATMPVWVEDIAKQYLSVSAFHLSLIDKNETRASINVTHLALLCPYEERPSTLSDVIRVYCKSSESRCIVFCERKVDADQLATHDAMASDCHVFHGDIPQDKRELVLQKFREGKYRVLITTNVAARGLDIPSVDLVIQCHPPRDVEDYIHRSGRTGRADRAGISICFYTVKERALLSRIEEKAGIVFRRISAPTVQDIAEVWGQEMSSSLLSIPKSTWSKFIPLALSFTDMLKSDSKLKNNENLMASPDISVEKKKPKSKVLLQALCCALARLSGKDGEIEARSALTAQKGFTAYRLDLEYCAQRKGLAYAVLKRHLPDEVVDSIKSLSFIRGKMGFVFDLPSTNDEVVQSNWPEDSENKLTLLTEIPDLEPEANDFMTNFNGRKPGFGGADNNRWKRGINRGSQQRFSGRGGKRGFGNESSKFTPKRFKWSDS